MSIEDIPLCVPALSEKERAYLLECVDSGFVSSVGPFVERFERAFAEWVGSKYAIACASGTAAIHLALQSIGVGPGDLVLSSDFTFIATVNPIRYLGATAGFVDSEATSWNMDADALNDALSELRAQRMIPKAVVVAHIYGAPADMGPILDVCESFGVTVIEDAAESLGAWYRDDYPNANCRGRKAGTIGRLGCFSFNGNKLITSGGGGMVATDDSRLAAWVKHVSCQAKLSGAGFVHDQVGYNYRMINIAAALGLAQLERIDSLLERKAEIAKAYHRFAARYGFGWQSAPAGTESSYWMSAISLPGKRDALQEWLLGKGIGCRPGWLPVSALAPYRNAQVWGRGTAARLADSVLCLPCSTSLRQCEQDTVIQGIEEWTCSRIHS